METFWVWAIALAAYGLFLGWYLNWRGALRPAEVDAFMARIAATESGDNGRNELETLRRFLADDDGREFFMLNVIRMASQDVADPVTGQLRSPREVMAGYTKMFMPALFARGGHPALAARKIGGFFDTWGMDDSPEWSFIGYMRYRSRRDLAILVCDPRFSGAHDFKYAAMPQTFNFPTRPMILMLASPKVWVALALALAAALAQVALLLAKGS